MTYDELIKDFVRDDKLSKELFEDIEDLAPNMCYNNVFMAADHLMDKLKTGEYKIAYGYWQSIENIYARHAFFVNESEKKVIDPTAGFVDYKAKQYLIFHRFEWEEYLDVLWKEDGQPALYKHFRKIDDNLFKDCWNNGIVLMKE